MNLLRGTLLVALFVCCAYSYGEESKSRVATESDLVGYWSVMLLKRFEAEGPVKNKQMFQNGECNVWVLRGDGKFVNLVGQTGDRDDQGKFSCVKKIEQIENGLVPLRAMSTPWSTWRAAGPRNPGIFFTNGPSGSPAFVWNVGYAGDELTNESVAMNYGFAIKNGDLVFNLIQPQAATKDPSGNVPFRIVWSMVLRRIAE